MAEKPPLHSPPWVTVDPRVVSAAQERISLEPASTGDLVIGGGFESMTVELMGDGRLRVPREATREILRDRLARAELLPTGPGWAVLRATGLTKPPSSRERAEADREVVVCGVLGESSIALIDIIGFLSSGLQTGALSVMTGDVERAIYLLSGDVVWASSNAPEDHIGEFLVRRGQITRAELSQIIQASPARVGRACVERGVILAHELWRLVQDQLREIFDKLLATERGVWAFSRVREEMLRETKVTMPTQGLLMDAIRKLDEMRVYRESVRSTASVVRRIEASSDAKANPGARLSRLEAHDRELAIVVYSALPERASIQDLMRMMGKGEYEITRLVYHLHKAQLVEILTEEHGPVTTRPSVDMRRSQGHDVALIYSMAMREIFEEMTRAGQADHLHQAAAEFLKSAASEHADILRAVRLLPDGAIDETALIVAAQAMQVSPQQLSDALSEVLFFLLFEATDLLGPRRRDDLARRVKMIHQMLALKPDSDRK